MIVRISNIYLLVICCIVLRLCESLTRKALYKRNTSYDSMSCQGTDIIISGNLPNVQSCLSHCTGKRCQAVFYNPGTNDCLGCNAYYENAEGQSQVLGNLAYMFEFDCPNGYGKYKTSCYYVTQQSTTWIDGKTLCTSVTNGNLVVIDSDEENKFLVSWLASLGLQDTLMHIGVFYDEGNWVTVHGSISYINWDNDQPNSRQFGEECVAMINANGRWHDVHCHSVMISVCEIDMLP